MYIVTSLALVCFIYTFFVKKDYYSVNTYIYTGIFLPLTLYLFNWSDLIVQERSVYFDYIFVSLYILSLFYLSVTREYKLTKYTKGEISITKFGRYSVPFLSIMYIVLVFVENYVGSRTLIPAMRGIDIHTFSLPIITYYTATPFLPVVINYYAFKATHKKKHILWILLILFTPVITRSSRLNVVIAVVEFASLLLFFEGSAARASLKKLRNYKRFKRVLFLSVIFAAVGLIALTTTRMNHYGKYNMIYADVIKYTGPKWTEFLSPYYGYFPLSFNNLNVNMLTRNINHNYLGIYSFTCLYFGLLQIDNLLGVPLTGQIEGRYISSVSATVPTGFWDFYYDYGFLCFIPVVVAFIICFVILKKGSSERKRLTYRTLYFWFVPLWFFMSFQNLIFGSSVLVMGLIIYFVVKRSFEIIDTVI